MQRCPRDECYDSYFGKEQRVDVACVKVLLEQRYRHEVDNTSGDLDQEHLERDVVDLYYKTLGFANKTYLSVDIQNFDKDQRAESNCDNIGIGVIEH